MKLELRDVHLQANCLFAQMEVDLQQNLQGDQRNDYQGFGSDYQPSSQSRKMSVGVMADSFAKKVGMKDQIIVPNTEMLNTESEPKHKNEGLTTAIKRKQDEAHGQVSSPWITTRSFYQKVPTSGTDLSVKQTSSLPGAGVKQKKPNGVKHAPFTYSVKLFANETSVLQSVDAKQDKVNGITNKMNGEKGRIPERVEEFTFAATQEVLVPQKAVNVMKDNTDKAENRGTEALRMKLLEILGTVSSPKSQYCNYQDHKVGASNLDSAQVVNREDAKNLKPRQNSDTIEMDSGSPVPAVNRPVTRSLLHKRAAKKVQPSKSKLGSSSNYKGRQQEKNIFSFQKEYQCKLDNAAGTRSKRKRSQRKDAFKRGTVCFTGEDGADWIHKENYGWKTPRSTKKTSSFKKTGNHNVTPPVDNSDFQEAQNTIQERELNQSSVRNKENQQSDLDSPASAEKGHQEENIANTSLKKFMDLQNDLESPTFGIKAPKSIPSPTSMAETVQMEESDLSLPPEERRFSLENICSIRTFKTSKQFDYESSPQIELSDDLEKFQDYAAKEQTPVKSRKGAEDNLSESSLGEGLQVHLQKFQDYAAKKQTPVESKESPDDGLSESSSSSGDSDSSKEGQRERGTFSGNCSPEKSKFMLSPTKTVSDLKGIRIDELSPNLPFPEGVHENDCLAESSEQDQEDGLGSAVTILALALENFERKLASAAKKKSSEILISVSNGIKLQLQNAEFQIQTDLENLTSLSNSKRKHVETRLQENFAEQKERFRLLHEKFKEEISYHIQDCRSIIEGLEMQKIELKGTQKKQKTSHKKLISQLEEAVQNQLDDAHRRITAVNELARGKMLQLKRILGQCLKEGILD